MNAKGTRTIYRMKVYARVLENYVTTWLHMSDFWKRLQCHCDAVLQQKEQTAPLLSTATSTGLPYLRTVSSIVSGRIS